MAIYGSSPLAVSARRNLSASIALAAKKGTLRITDELLGYALRSQAVAEAYGPPPSAEPVPRRIAAPEALTGAVANKFA